MPSRLYSGATGDGVVTRLPLTMESDMIDAAALKVLALGIGMPWLLVIERKKLE